MYQAKRKTRASVAREKGLEALADLISEVGRGAREAPWEAARHFVNRGKGVSSVEEALSGAGDIIAEEAMADPEVKRKARESLRHGASFKAKLKKNGDPGSKYKAITILL